MNEEITFGGGKTSSDWIKEKLVKQIEVYIIGDIAQAAYEADLGLISGGELKYFSYVINGDDKYHEWHGENLIGYLSSLERGKGYALYATALMQEKFNDMDDEKLIDSPLVWWLGDIHVDGSFIAGPDLLFWLWELLQTGILPHAWHPDKIDFIDCSIKDKDILETINPERFSRLLNSHGWTWEHVIFFDEETKEKKGTQNQDEIEEYEKQGMEKLAERWYKEIRGRKIIADVPGDIEVSKALRMGEALEAYAKAERISELTALLELGVNVTRRRRRRK
jgi:hypothetical protein